MITGVWAPLRRLRFQYLISHNHHLTSIQTKSTRQTMKRHRTGIGIRIVRSVLMRTVTRYTTITIIVELRVHADEQPVFQNLADISSQPRRHPAVIISSINRVV